MCSCLVRVVGCVGSRVAIRLRLGDAGRRHHSRRRRRAIGTGYVRRGRIGRVIRLLAGCLLLLRCLRSRGQVSCAQLLGLLLRILSTLHVLRLRICRREITMCRVEGSASRLMPVAITRCELVLAMPSSTIRRSKQLVPHCWTRRRRTRGCMLRLRLDDLGIMGRDLHVRW